MDRLFDSFILGVGLAFGLIAGMLTLTMAYAFVLALRRMFSDYPDPHRPTRLAGRNNELH